MGLRKRTTNEIKFLKISRLIDYCRPICKEFPLHVTVPIATITFVSAPLYHYLIMFTCFVLTLVLCIYVYPSISLLHRVIVQCVLRC